MIDLETLRVQAGDGWPIANEPHAPLLESERVEPLQGDRVTHDLVRSRLDAEGHRSITRPSAHGRIHRRKPPLDPHEAVPGHHPQTSETWDPRSSISTRRRTRSSRGSQVVTRIPARPGILVTTWFVAGSIWMSEGSSRMVDVESTTDPALTDRHVAD